VIDTIRDTVKGMLRDNARFKVLDTVIGMLREVQGLRCMTLLRTL
jgi:hypothetical protein